MYKNNNGNHNGRNTINWYNSRGTTSQKLDNIPHITTIVNGTKRYVQVTITADAAKGVAAASYGLTAANAKSISREYGVSEQWLLYGTGDMYLNKDTSSLDAYIRSNDVSPLEAEILNAYCDLDPGIRRAAMEHFCRRLGRYFAAHPEQTVPDNPEDRGRATTRR